MQAHSQEEWIEKLKNKYRIMRQLYNEALLNLYIRPVMEGRTEPSAETAQEFVRQIRQAVDEDFDDGLSMLEMAEALLDYFEIHGPLEAYIWDLSLLVILYNCSSEQEDGRKAYDYCQKVCQLKDRYFEISDFDVRKRIIYAFYNRSGLQVNFCLDEDKTLRSNLDEALEFYNNPDVLALDGDKLDFTELIEELNYDTLGTYVISHTRGKCQKWVLERAKQVLEGYYQKELSENPNPYAMPDEIYCYYKRTLFFLGEITCTEFLDDYKKFCDYSIANDTLEHPDGFWESKLFQVAVNHLPRILQCLNLYGNEYHGDPSLRIKCVKDYLEIIRKLPRTGNSRFVNDVIGRSLESIMDFLTAGDVETDVLINVLINRDEITLIHSRMVGQIAGLLLNAVIENKPELLIGSLGCQDLVEVLERREQISAFVSQAAKLFDIGKLKSADIVNKQSRQLTARELEHIYRHPETGAKLIQKAPELARFHDVVL